MSAHVLRRLSVALGAVAGALLLTACSSSGGVAEDAAAAPPTPVAGAAAASFDFPSGPASVVAAGYEPSRDGVASTGAFLPANGKPTLVFVDAIW
jgi:hypothetical protein